MDIISTLGPIVAQSPPLLAALILGVMTSLSPCPLGSNLAATAMLARGAASRNAGLISCLVYAFGRICAYLLIGVFLGFLGSQTMQLFAPLQAYSGLFLAAILGISGLALLGKLPLSFSFETGRLGVFVKMGALGAFVLGFGLAFVFCPVSAALFLGGVVPLLFSTHDYVGIPLAYGLGTALTVILLAMPLILMKEKGKKMFKLSFGWIKTIERGLGLVFLAASAFYLLEFLKLI